MVTAEIYHGDEMDVTTLVETVDRARSNLFIAGAGRKTREVVADKGYHSTGNLCDLEEMDLQPVIADRYGRRRWTRRPDRERDAVYANRRKNRTKRGRKLQRLRSEMTERTFAHVCDQGGARRTWIRGLKEVAKRYLMQVAARNLSTIMRKLFGVGKPKGLRKANCSILAALAPFGCWLAIVRPSIAQTRTSRFDSLVGYAA